MKSVCQSMMLITSSFGNLVVVIFTKVTKRDVSIAQIEIQYLLNFVIKYGMIP